MWLEPIHSVISAKFYRTVSSQPLRRTFLYLLYLSFLSALAWTLFLKIWIEPDLNKTFDWLGKSMPELELSKGRITSNLKGPVVLRHPDLPELSFIVDTARTTPVGPEELTKGKVSAFLAANALYMLKRDGTAEVYDLSSMNTVKDAPPVKINAEFFSASRAIFLKMIYPAAFVVALALSILWELLTTLFYSLLALIANSLAAARLPYGALFTVSLYAQTLMIFVHLILIIGRWPLPFSPIISFGCTAVYIYLAIKAHQQSPETASAPPAA